MKGENMLRMVCIACLVGLLSLGLIFTGYAEGHQQLRDKNPKEPKYEVFSVTGMDKTVTIVIVDQELERVWRKERDMDYKAAVKNWEAAKKEALKNEMEFTDPKPRKPLIKVLKKGLSKEAADAFKQQTEFKMADKKTVKPPAGKEKPKKYSLLMIKGMSKAVVFKVLEDESVKAYKKELVDNYKQTLKDWEISKKEASKKKLTFTDPKPSMPEVKTLKRGLSTDKANELLQKEEEKYEKKTAVAEGNSKRKGKK
ncbi:MAG: hypothetical protein ACYTG7_07115 [Planctomycetota bacterium]|jgi:hypothetical protein